MNREPHDESKWTTGQARRRLKQIRHLELEMGTDTLDERSVLANVRAKIHAIHGAAVA